MCVSASTFRPCVPRRRGRIDGVKAYSNTVTFVHREALAVLRARMYKKERTDDSLGGPRLRDERRVGRLEAVALERPEVELVVEPVLGVELGHEVLHGRRRAGRAVKNQPG